MMLVPCERQPIAHVPPLFFYYKPWIFSGRIVWAETCFDGHFGRRIRLGWVGGLVPIKPEFFQLAANAPQVPDAQAVLGDDHHARAVRSKGGAAGGQVGVFEACQFTAR